MTQGRRIAAFAASTVLGLAACSDAPTAVAPSLARAVATPSADGRYIVRLNGQADAFRARVVDATTESFVFEMTGSSEKLNAFIALMDPLGLVEVSRTGTVAIARGPSRF